MLGGKMAVHEQSNLHWHEKQHCLCLSFNLRCAAPDDGLSVLVELLSRDRSQYESQMVQARFRASNDAGKKDINDLVGEISKSDMQKSMRYPSNSDVWRSFSLGKYY